MINITMMGKFILEHNGKTISQDDNRSKKMWLLLAYLLIYRGKNISSDEIVEFLWEDEGKVTNTSSAVKTTVHRLRAMLSELSSAELITYMDKGYRWNDSVSTSLDIDLFKDLCSSDSLDDNLKAADMYQELLPTFRDARWLDRFIREYRKLYVDTVLKCCSSLFNESRYDEVISMCQKACEIDILNEELYSYHIRALMAVGDNAEVIRVYENMSSIFINDYGKLPSEEIRTVYRQVLQTSNKKYMPADEIRESLREPGTVKGAFILEYDFFKTVYQTVARSVSRMEHGAHISVLSIKEPEGRELQERSLSIAASNLQNQIMTNIRKGDSVTKCSATQFIILLPNCSHENGCMVSERIISAFYRKHPHSPVEIGYSVQEVESM